MSRKEYFAYGSNLNFEQMAYRCPEERFQLFTGWLLSVFSFMALRGVALETTICRALYCLSRDHFFPILRR